MAEAIAERAEGAAENGSGKPSTIVDGSTPPPRNEGVARELAPLKDEPEQMAEDIRANGLLDPIILHEGKILDGRNRYAACGRAGVEPRFEEFGGDDPLTFVISKNLVRRHLDESQRAMVGSKLARLPRGANQHAPNGAPSQDEAAGLLNVSRRSIQRARQVEEEAPDLAPKIEAGELALGRAERILRDREALKKREVRDKREAPL